MSALGLIEIPLLSITALATAEVREEELSASAIVRCFAKPDSALDAMIEFPNAQNPLDGGRDQFFTCRLPKA